MDGWLGMMIADSVWYKGWDAAYLPEAAHDIDRMVRRGQTACWLEDHDAREDTNAGGTLWSDSWGSASSGRPTKKGHGSGSVRENGHHGQENGYRGREDGGEHVHGEDGGMLEHVSSHGASHRRTEKGLVGSFAYAGTSTLSSSPMSPSSGSIHTAAQLDLRQTSPILPYIGNSGNSLYLHSQRNGGVASSTGTSGQFAGVNGNGSVGNGSMRRQANFALPNHHEQDSERERISSHSSSKSDSFSQDFPIERMPSLGEEAAEGSALHTPLSLRPIPPNSSSYQSQQRLQSELMYDPHQSQQRLQSEMLYDPSCAGAGYAPSRGREHLFEREDGPVDGHGGKLLQCVS